MGRGHESAAGGGSEALAKTRETPQENIDATPVEIGGETIYVGELSLNQVGSLMRVAAQAISRMDQETRAELQQTAGGQAANLTAAISLFSEETLCALFGVVLNKPAAWCGVNVKARHLLAIVDAVVERNDWKELWAGFLRLRGRFASSLAAA